MIRTALYARVSTSDQQTLDIQLQSMRAYAIHRGWEITMQVHETAALKKEDIKKLAKKGYSKSRIAK